MSTLSAALAAYLQNNDTIGPLVTGVVSGRNFSPHDDLLEDPPHTYIFVADLPVSTRPYVGTVSSGNVRTNGQLEVRVTSRASEYAADYLADLLAGPNGILWMASSIPDNGVNLPWGITNCLRNSDISDDLLTWAEILTINYIA
jgi:hypothetical protein